MIGKGMKRFFAFALAALVLLSGCCPGRTALSPSVSDSLQVEREVRYVEKLRDTVIYVEVPVESRRVRVAADSSFLETSLATSSARVAADGTLSHTLENKPQRQPVGVTVRDTFERESELSGSVRTERVEVPVKVPLSWFQKSLMGCGLFALAFGVDFGGMLSGAILTETVFNWPGIGWEVYRAISMRDWPIVMGGVTLIVIVVMVINLLVDISYAFLDPRIRLGGPSDKA